MLRWAIDTGALALILVAMQGCGSSSSSGSTTSDSGAPEASTGADGSVDGQADAGPDCGALPPTGTQIVASTDPLVVFTLTDDGHAVYEDLTTQELYAVAVAGGKPSDIGHMTSQGGTIWSHGSTVLYLPSAADPQTSIAPLSAWTPGGGTSVISTTAVAVDSYYFTYDASKDGLYVAYFTTANDSTATLTISTVDGKTQTPLVTGIDLTDQNCFPPSVQFVNDTVVAQYCQVPGPDGGAEAATFAAFASPTSAPVILGSTFTLLGNFVPVDPTGKLALLPSPGGTGLSLYPLAGGTPVTVDATGTSGFFTPTGDILYTTTTSSLARYSATTGMSTTLVSGGLGAVFDLSPDGNWVQAADKQNQTTELTDLYLASATTPGTATAVVTTTTASAGGFTADSSYSIFGTNFPTDFGVAPYDLQASKTSGGAPVKVLAAVGRALATGGSKLVCNTNGSKSTGAADIVSLDLSTTAAPTPLVTQADPNLFLSSTNQVVYSWYCHENGTAGIWALTPP